MVKSNHLDGKSRLPIRVALLVSICGLASVIGTSDLVSLDDGTGWQAARDSVPPPCCLAED